MEVFDIRPLRQPPTILPISSIFWPIRVNCFDGISFNSQQSCMKNLSESMLDKDWLSKGILVSMAEKDAFCKISKRSVNKKSIF